MDLPHRHVCITASNKRSTEEAIHERAQCTLDPGYPIHHCPTSILDI